jgi:hypothetical protein
MSIINLVSHWVLSAELSLFRTAAVSKADCASWGAHATDTPRITRAHFIIAAAERPESLGGGINATTLLVFFANLCAMSQCSEIDVLGLLRRLQAV